MNQAFKEEHSKLAITRAQSELVDITKQGKECGVNVVALPFFDYQEVNFNIPSDKLATIDWLAFTSARGVDYFFNSLDNCSQAISTKTRFAVVGEKTARALAERGFKPNLQPDKSSSGTMFKGLLDQLDNHESIVYVGAESVRLDPVKDFQAANLDYRRLIVYRAEPQSPASDIVDSLGREDSILFTSPGAALRFSELFEAPKANIIAIGEITAEVICELDWNDAEVLVEPDMSLALKSCLQHH